MNVANMWKVIFHMWLSVCAKQMHRIVNYLQEKVKIGQIKTLTWNSGVQQINTVRPGK